jgi:GGDEF domain-containing protein
VKSTDYSYFLLLYIDILMSSYQIRDLIMNIYFTKRLTSIYRDPLTNLSNYFQLKDDIENNKEANSLLMFNIKEFSKINMLYGHKTGDRIIK